MAILVDQNTRLLIQGITGREAQFHGQQMIDYGTNVVAGATPGKGGQQTLGGIPVFNTVEAAVRETGANASVIYVPARFASDAALEAIEAGLPVIIIITEHIPVGEMVTVYHEARRKGARFVGPNSPGVISPGKAKVGIMPGHIHRPGRIGVISRSGTLTYEVVWALTGAGFGQSTCIGIGGDPIIGTSFVDALAMFENDQATDAVVLIGEIGGNDEQLAADYIAKHMTKPVVGFVAGLTAPPGKRMGHAGAIISGGEGTAQEKLDAFSRNGVTTVESPSQIPDRLRELLGVTGA